MINSRDIKELHPVVRARCESFLRACDAAGIDVILTSTYRDNESQAALYAVGRTVKGANPRITRPMGNRVTNARPGYSIHNYRLAFDCVPIVNGKAVWDDDKLWDKIGAIGELCGLAWAGRWQGSLREKAHFQYTGGLTLDQLRSGMLPNTPKN